MQRFEEIEYSARQGQRFGALHDDHPRLAGLDYVCAGRALTRRFDRLQQFA